MLLPDSQTKLQAHKMKNALFDTVSLFVMRFHFLQRATIKQSAAVGKQWVQRCIRSGGYERAELSSPYKYGYSGPDRADDASGIAMSYGFP